MLELLEELHSGAKKTFQKQVHMNELTALSINGIRGQALILTNRYLYLVSKGLFKSTCQKISPQELEGIEVKGDSLLVKTHGGGSPLKITLPADKTVLLPSMADRIHQWHQEKKCNQA